jgi:hypothetical protein
MGARADRALSKVSRELMRDREITYKKRCAHTRDFFLRSKKLKRSYLRNTAANRETIASPHQRLSQ